jgi:predicted nuclease of restriction endonuclease-like RecB superfamily
MQVAKLLLTYAKEDIGNNYFKTRDLITSIQCLRMNKIVQGIQQVQGPVTITLRNLSSFECNQVRHLFLGGMDHFHQLSDMVVAAESSSEQTRTQTTGTAPL